MLIKTTKFLNDLDNSKADYLSDEFIEGCFIEQNFEDYFEDLDNIKFVEDITVDVDLDDEYHDRELIFQIKDRFFVVPITYEPGFGTHITRGVDSIFREVKRIPVQTYKYDTIKEFHCAYSSYDEDDDYDEDDEW